MLYKLLIHIFGNDISSIIINYNIKCNKEYKTRILKIFIKSYSYFNNYPFYKFYFHLRRNIIKIKNNNKLINKQLNKKLINLIS